MSLKPGEELKIHSYSTKADTFISELVKLSLAELAEKEHDSIDKEQAIYEEMSTLEKKWEKQAGFTDQIRKAKEYLMTPSPSHTANTWKLTGTSWHEISNMVYRMSWHVYEKDKYDKTAEKTIVVSWQLSWSLSFNAPKNSDCSWSGHHIDGQEKKHFTDKATMEKYLQGRINAYAHLFTEISPPIPKGKEQHFSINGVLLPGYTVEVPEQTPQEVADDLLAYLDDEDTLPLPPVEPEKPQRQPFRHPVHKNSQPHRKRDFAPTR